MSLHYKNLDDGKRFVLVCGNERIEIFCKTDFIEFCPICGDSILLAKCGLRNDS